MTREEIIAAERNAISIDDPLGAFKNIFLGWIEDSTDDELRAMHAQWAGPSKTRLERRELRFADEIEAAFQGIFQIERQRAFGKYRVDFYFPLVAVAVEFDEENHDSPKAKARDAQRQREIESHGIRFVRIHAKEQLTVAINRILQTLLQVES